VTPGASTRQTRTRSRFSSKRSQARREAVAEKKKRTRSKRRRGLGIGMTLLAGLAIGLAVVNREELGETIREVTLPLRHEDIIRQESVQHGVPPDTIAAVIFVESHFRDQTSEAGARGLMQITPRTAEIIEKLSGGTDFSQEDLADPDVNIAYGTFYLRHLLDKFGGNEVAALAAYNGGETNVGSWGGADLKLDDIQFQETRDYVERVLEKRDEYRAHYADELGLQ
jgi:soluble lytic murein transglycosylase